jgi:nucleotide-binding universal stress UspA family protein
MLENFKHVLVTTDFSATGDSAIDHAFRIAADHGAEVILCHIIDDVPPPNPLYAHYYRPTAFSRSVPYKKRARCC